MLRKERISYSIQVLFALCRVDSKCHVYVIHLLSRVQMSLFCMSCSCLILPPGGRKQVNQHTNQSVIISDNDAKSSIIVDSWLGFLPADEF